MLAPWTARLALVAAASLTLLGCSDDGSGSGAVDQQATSDDVVEQPIEEAVGASVVDVRIVGVRGYAGGDLAVVVAREVDGLVVGGFATRVESDEFTTTQTVREPRETEVMGGPWPSVTEESALLAPGAYVLMLWLDTGLDGYTRWLPVNTDGQGLAGCIHRFEVADRATTEVVISGDVTSSGYLGVCTGPAPHDEPVVPRADVVELERQPAAEPFAHGIIGDANGFVSDLIAWRDGFLAVGLLEGPRPLPEALPAEIADQFPPEIQDLFPDGLPDTLDEALEVIEAAGMMAEVEQAVSAIPGAYDAIFAVEPPRAPLFAWSQDGVVWDQLDVRLPDDVEVVLDVAAAGDELVVAGRRSLTSDAPAALELSVAQTRDLSTWTTARFEPPQPPDLPDGAGLEVVDAVLVANDLGWMISEQRMLDLETSEPPPDPSPELQPYLSESGWGMYEPVTTYSFAPWGGEPGASSPSGSAVPAHLAGMMVATNTGFVHLGDTVRYSIDGTTWATQSVFDPGFEFDPWTSFSQRLPDGFVVYLDGLDGGPVVLRADDTGMYWTRVVVPGLPADLGPAELSNGSGYALDIRSWTEEMSQWLLATPDGDRWVVEQVDVIDEIDDDYVPRIAALLDDTLLVGDAIAGSGEWWVYRF